MTRVADDTVSGGMVALVLTDKDAARLAVPAGESRDQLHLTLTYLGPDASQLDALTREAILSVARTMAADLSPIAARVFGHATFNPDGHDDRDPCAVYLIGDTASFSPLKETFDPYAAESQHEPFIAHVTAGYGLTAADLTYIGPVVFDAIRVAIGDDVTDFSLNGAPPEEKELTVSDTAEHHALTWVTARDPFTAGVLLGIAGLEEGEAQEWKAGPPGATFPSPDPGATKLREYWVHGKGAAKIRWGQHGDFNRCVNQMRKHVGVRAKGLCNIYHRSALGVAPGQEKKASLWVPDDREPGGWRAESVGWEMTMVELGTVENKAFAVATRPPVSHRDDEDDPEAALDRYADLSEGEQLTTEEAYEEAIGADVAWELEPDGELSRDDEDSEDSEGDEVMLFDRLDDLRSVGRT